MAVLGKRKARPPPNEPPASEQQDIQDVFRRHFESRFEPLRLQTPLHRPRDGGGGVGDSDGGEDAESEWGGLSDDDDDDDDASDDDQETGAIEHAPAVEVVDYSVSQTPSSPSAAMSKREFKAFMSSRPPDQAAKAEATTTGGTSTPSSSSSTIPEDAPSLLAQDLELRRLLAESHLLSPHPSVSTPSATTTATPKSFTAGRTRHKATDLRIQALGSNISILKQDKMPMNMRKGIVGAAASREAKRRREARENGVILERELGKKMRRNRARDGAVDRPGVGRLKGAELRLSERDVKSIEGGRDTFGRRGARGR
ncbi:hypothetical protein HRG_005421 [Hirsutella rhossiliensis]|uniref:Uncharacterized protein n=1 Tax=Hirsutella rhossiliensis TaxID=111463 RepID=A0A9P8SHK1_9HYPO|nr:uncharacterized protein HRG_05421 [Hirsutella rhossiliensis]KAH0962911.1 hypothetical protein HRG_05421 [Hirsutella rhossiliensis]